MKNALPGQVLGRVLAGIAGSWLFVAGLISAGVLVLMRFGMAYSDAQTLMFLLGGLVLLAAFLWAFAATKLWRVWLVLAGGGLLMMGAATLFARAAAG